MSRLAVRSVYFIAAAAFVVDRLDDVYAIKIGQSNTEATGRTLRTAP